jgi:Zn finger protein HypA/HybF involved in hydrogenase expression
MPRLSIDTVIRQIEEKQPGKYGFDKLVYKSYRGKITLFCNVHKEYFETTFVSAITTSSCKKCIKEEIPTRLSHTKDQFVSRAIEVHGDKYSYEEVEYVNSQTKIKIWCKNHKTFFSQIPNSHLRGNGCPLCSATNVAEKINNAARERFVTEAKKVNPDYDYSKALYISAHRKVEVVCHKHESFWIRPTNILAGIGCPSCSKNGYNIDRSGHLYVLTCGDITKIGITNRLVSRRQREISKSFGHKFDLFRKYFFEDGRHPYELERILLQELREQHLQPSKIFDGRTESFLSVNNEILIARIEQLIKEQYSSKPASQEA